MSVRSPLPLSEARLNPTDIQPHRDRWAALALTALAAIALGYAVHDRLGTYSPRALAWLTVALLACAGGLLLPDLRRLEPVARSCVPPLLLGGLALQLVCLFTSPPGAYLQISGLGDFDAFFTLLAVAAVLAASGMAARPWIAQWRMPLLLLVFVLAGVWVIRNSPSPYIDVYTVHQQSAAALRGGVNPYSITFPDIYDGTSNFFQPGVSVGGRLQFGYPYLPATLLLAMPGYLAAGETRYSQLACVAAAAALMASARRTRWGVVAASMFLLTPRGFQVVECAWTEPFLVLLLSATVFCAARRPGALPYVLGAFLTSKQYAPFFAPLALLLLPQPWSWRGAWGVAWRAGAVAAAINLPFVLWDVRAFLHSTMSYQLGAPFRSDSLSYLAWWVRSGGSNPSPALGFLAMAAATALALWRAPRTASGFAAGVALVCGSFFAFGKQAFLNNYYFVIAALWCAVAAAEVGGPAGSNARARRERRTLERAAAGGVVGHPPVG